MNAHPIPQGAIPHLAIPQPDFLTKPRIGRGIAWGVACALVLIWAALLLLGGDAAMKSDANLFLALGVLFGAIACATSLAAKIEMRLIDIEREIARGNRMQPEAVAAARQAALDAARNGGPIP
ncbi:MAG: hypothetical protein ABI963_11065 [Rhizomicrobium sp.]